MFRNLESFFSEVKRSWVESRDERQNISGCFCFFCKASFRDENITSKIFSASSLR